MRYLAGFLLMFMAHSAFSQNMGWEELDSQRIHTTTTGMYILGSWALANLVTNPVLSKNAVGSNKYFYQMNTMWNVVNVGLAGVSLWQSSNGNATADTWYAAYQEQQSTEKIFLFNTALDVAYVAGGLYLLERSKNAINNADRLNGYGKGVILQGAFLFVFDLGMYVAHHGAEKEWARLLEHVRLGPTGLGMTIPIH